MAFKPLPIGVDDFAKLIGGNYYYVDKTLFIKELLDMKEEVNLFTRPRRFGKTLVLSMIRSFFENTGSEAENCRNRELFSGLNIMEQGEHYTRHMGQYPVISLSLKSGKQASFEYAFGCLREVIADEFDRHRVVCKALELREDREKYLAIAGRKGEMQDYLTALTFLSKCLFRYYGRKAVILIDEYDVPLENAYFSGFYEEMISFIRTLFESALKTNAYMEFALVTGCLRITKESIFTGLNNLKMISILSDSYGEHFGFVQREVDEILEYYDRSFAGEVMKEWYDGYRFGQADVYNPWSVINYVDALSQNTKALPGPYWANTSSNAIVRDLVENADVSVRGKLEDLIDGGAIEIPMHEEITYGDIHQSEDNLWNFLFFTGYLKRKSVRLEEETRYIGLAIPNVEVRYIYKNTILKWFDQMIGSKDLGKLYQAIEDGDTQVMEEEISKNLQETISFYDYAENYYHGFLAGLLKNMKRYRVISNRESGLGRPDIEIKSPSVRGLAVLIEIKTVKEFQAMRSGCQEAVDQIISRNYEEGLRKEGYDRIHSYGVCFYQKECMVIKK